MGRHSERLLIAAIAALAGCAPTPRAAPPPEPPPVPAPVPPAPPPRATLILTNGVVRTLGPGPWPTTVVVMGDSIAALGDATLVGRWRGPDTRVLDLAGATVLPSLIDHHAHLFNVGYALLNEHEPDRMFEDLAPATTLAEVATGVRRRARSLAPGSWLLGNGWSQAQWRTQQLPTHDVLTLAAPRHPVFLSRVDGHAGWANRAALERAGLWQGEANDPPGGLVLRTRTGRATGVLLERANEPVVALLPPLSDGDIIRSWRLGAEELAARGVARVYDAGPLAPPGIVALNLDFGRYLALLRRADSLAPLPVAVSIMVPAPSRLADSLLASGLPRLVLSPRLTITHVKLFADGALGSRGAALTHPYADDGSTTGVARMTTEAILDLTRRALDRGLGVATHAIGNEAVARALDAYETVLAERPRLDPHRLRIEHFSYASEADMQRAVRLGVVLSIQSNFNGFADEHPSFAAVRVGPENESLVYAWDRLYRMGAVLAEGSDFFARPTEGPLSNVLATLTRVNAVGAARPDAEGRLLSWRMNATWFPQTGAPVDPTLRPGSVADLAIVRADPFSVPRERIWATRMLLTIRGGQPVWAADSLRPGLGLGGPPD